MWIGIFQEKSTVHFIAQTVVQCALHRFFCCLEQRFIAVIAKSSYAEKSLPVKELPVAESTAYSSHLMKVMHSIDV